MVTLLDNKKNGRVINALRSSLETAQQFSLLTSEFSIFAYDALKAALVNVETVKLLFSSATKPLGTAPAASDLLGGPEERSLRNQLLSASIARECAGWIHAKVDVRAFEALAPHTICLADGSATQTAIQGSSTFSAPGLGLVPSARFEMNTLVEEAPQVKTLAQYFWGLWNDNRLSKEVKAAFLNELEKLYHPRSAQEVYLAVLTALFHDALDKLHEDEIVKSDTGVKDTLVWQKLYRFQRDGVLGAIDKIERHNGCIIADSVGLGKTFEALAIIKYYELRNDRVLVLAPKRLRENWTLYTINDKRNILAGDRFNYDVLNHTDLTRTRGKSGEINLKTINWGNYDLVVIDESHNFRNRPSPKNDGLTRYKRLMEQVIRAGVKTRVLMLSATPVNNRMNDLKNQVAFITEGNDNALGHSGIASLEQTLRKAQTRFNAWFKQDTEDRTTESLLDSLNFDYFKLLDLLTIARSRKHIEKYYDLAEIGQFPRRLTPKNIRADIDSAGLFPPLREVNKDIRRMRLSAYAPLQFLRPEKREEYSRKYDIKMGDGRLWKQSDREENLIHLMRVNLLKRMESSIHSFTLTLKNLLGKVEHLLQRIEEYASGEVWELGIEDIDIDSDDFNQVLVGSKVKVLLKDVDLIRWKQDLYDDQEILVKILREAQQVDAARDEKLRKLKDLIREKVKNPINTGNKKILIFTAFADTASYLYENTANWAVDELGVHSAIFTGGSGRNATTLSGTRLDLVSILTAFSPVSKERAAIDASLVDEIDILIGTDCISEGQNLQDCDYLVNFDIHWNPVRIIQRFGRVDRLGSRNEVIQLVNFWPNMELDEYINLEARVSSRMVLLDISATGEENVIEPSSKDQMNDLAYRKKQLERLQQEVVDLEELGGGVSITDPTLNDFKMDLGAYLKRNQGDSTSLPLGSYSVVVDDDLIGDLQIQPGAIFCLRCENQNVAVDVTYALAPHFVVYVADDGTVALNFLSTRRILEIFKKLSLGRSSPDTRSFARWNELTNNESDTSHYRELLAKAVAAITGKAEERGVESLFERGGTAISKDSYKGLEDFEVVAFLVVLKESDP